MQFILKHSIRCVTLREQSDKGSGEESMTYLSGELGK